jgi:hypothetical protein
MASPAVLGEIYYAHNSTSDNRASATPQLLGLHIAFGTSILIFYTAGLPSPILARRFFDLTFSNNVLQVLVNPTLPARPELLVRFKHAFAQTN